MSIYFIPITKEINYRKKYNISFVKVAQIYYSIRVPVNYKNVLMLSMTSFGNKRIHISENVTDAHA